MKIVKENYKINVYLYHKKYYLSILLSLHMPIDKINTIW